MGQTLLTSVAVTVNGSLRDVSAPSGTTLQTLLNHMQIAGPAIDLDGRAIPGSARLGVDLPAGTLITILPAEWGQTRRRQVKNIQDTRGGQMYGFFAAAGLAAGLTVVAALVASYWQAAGRDGTIAELTTRAGSLAATPWLPLALAGVLFAVSLGFSLLPPNGRPLVEILPGTTFAVAASLALGLANPGDVRHQLLIVTLLAVGSSAFVRWVTWGHKRRTGGGVLLDVALASAIVAGLDLVFLAIGLPFELFIAGLLGILPALLAALGALTVRVDSEALVETSAVIREAPSVRRSTEQAELPEPTELVWLSSLRHKLWTILTSATIVAASAVMVRPLMSEASTARLPSPRSRASSSLFCSFRARLATRTCASCRAQPPRSSRAPGPSSPPMRSAGSPWRARACSSRSPSSASHTFPKSSASRLRASPIFCNPNHYLVAPAHPRGDRNY